MSGYAASARIVRASPRIVERDPGRAGIAAGRPAPVVDVQIDEPGASPAVSIAERWERFRERWAQLTFYLTDPESWR
jgi:hypothetical protein